MKSRNFFAILACVFFLSLTACTDTYEADQELYEETAVDKNNIERP